MQQLMMLWSKQPVPEPALPEGFEFRTYREGDALGWIEVCKEGLGTGTMTEEDFRKQMLGMEGVVPEGLFFIITDKGHIAGTATGVLKPDPVMGYLHMVSISPVFRGRGLAKPLNAAVLNFLVDHGRKLVTLHTDDFRIPAIKAYLSLGFRPILYADDMHERWQKVLQEAGYVEMDTYMEDGTTGPVIKNSGS